MSLNSVDTSHGATPPFYYFLFQGTGDLATSQSYWRSSHFGIAVIHSKIWLWPQLSDIPCSNVRPQCILCTGTPNLTEKSQSAVVSNIQIPFSYLDESWSYRAWVYRIFFKFLNIGECVPAQSLWARNLVFVQYRRLTSACYFLASCETHVEGLPAHSNASN